MQGLSPPLRVAGGVAEKGELRRKRIESKDILKKDSVFLKVVL